MPDQPDVAAEWAAYNANRQRQVAVGNTAQAADIPQASAVTAMQSAPVSGIPAAVGMQAPKVGQDIAQQWKDYNAIQNVPTIAGTAAQGPEFAAATKPYWDVLTKIDTAADDFVNGPLRDLYRAGKAIGDQQQAAFQQGGLAGLGAGLKANWQAGETLLGAPTSFGLPGMLERKEYQGLASVVGEDNAQKIVKMVNTSLWGVMPGTRFPTITSVTDIPQEGQTPQGQISGQLKLPAPQAKLEAPPPPAPPPHPIVGDWRVGQSGLLTHSDGAPLVFDNSKDAASWMVRAQSIMPKDGPSTLNIVPTEDGRWQIQHAEQVGPPSPLGTDEGVNATHEAEAEVNLQHVENIQSHIAETPMQEHGLTSTVLGHSALGDQFAWVPLEELPHLPVGFTDHLPPQDLSALDNLYEAAEASGSSHMKIPMPLYLALTSGQPFEQQLNQASRFSADGSSAKEVQEQSKENEAAKNQEEAYKTALTNYGLDSATNEDFQNLYPAIDWAQANSPELLNPALETAKAEHEMYLSAGAPEETITDSQQFLNKLQVAIATAQEQHVTPGVLGVPGEHWQYNEKGEPVTIQSPHTATPPISWHDPNQIATFVPAQNTMPEQLNGIPLQGSVLPQVLPPPKEVGEPPLKVVPGKKAAAGLIMVEPDGRVWVVSPTNAHAGYVNTFPKGTTNKNDHPQHTAIRETLAESGLLGEVTSFLGDVEKSGSVTRYYLGKRVAGSPENAGWESQAVHLVPPELLAQMITNKYDQPILERLKVAGVLKAGQVLQAAGATLERPKTIPSIANWKEVAKKPGGYNPGAIMEDENGVRWLVKGSNENDEGVAKAEVLAANLMKAAGIPAPEMKIVNLGDKFGGGIGVASMFFEGLKPADVNDLAQLHAMQEQFATHAWLSNRDVIGAGWTPNIYSTPAGEVLNVDPGGSLMYKGTGAKKADWGPNPTDFESMRDPKYTIPYAWFGAMDHHQLANSAAHLARVSDSSIDYLVKKLGFGDDVTQTLIARRDAILSKFNMTASHASTSLEYQIPSDIPEEAREFIDAIIAEAQPVVQKAMKDLWLKQLFSSPAAAGMDQYQFRKYSELLEQAHAAMQEKIKQRAFQEVRKYRTAAWRKTYADWEAKAMDAFVSLPEVIVRNLIFDGNNAPAANATQYSFVKDGKFQTFYHGSSYPYIGDKSVDPNPQHFYLGPWSQYGVMSFSTDPKFADDWVGNKKYSKYEDLGPTPYIAMGYSNGKYLPQYRTIYTVHVLAKNAADFEKSKDVQAAAGWWSKKTGNTAHYYENVLASGSYREWEQPMMWKALGWDAAKVLEHPKPNPKPKTPHFNIAVADGDLIKFTYETLGAMVADSLKFSLETQAYLKKNRPDLLKRLPKGIFGEDGLDPDEIADKFGSPSGEVLLNKLADMEQARGRKSFKNWMLGQIKDIATKAAQTQLGFGVQKEEMWAIAQEAAATYSVEKLLIDELQVLHNLTRQPITLDQMEQVATDRFNALPTKEAADIREYINELQRNAKAVEKGLLKNSPESLIEAFQAKQRQIINFKMLREAYGLIRQLKLATNAFKNAGRAPTSSSLDQDFYNQMRSIVRDVGGFTVRQGKFETLEAALKGVSRENFGEMLESTWGLAPVITDVPPGRKGFAGLTVDQFYGVWEMFRSLRGLGRDIHSVVAGADKLRLNQIADEVWANSAGIGRKLPPGELIRLKQKGIQYEGPMRKLGATVTRPEVQLYYMDNNKYGPLQKFMLGPMLDGKFKEAKMVQALSDKFTKFLKTQPSDWAKSLRKAITVPELTHDINRYGKPQTVLSTRGDLIVLLLNMGNEENFRKLCEGYGWDPKLVWSLALHHATQADWDYAQFIWDRYEDYWPEIEKLGRETRGLAPAKVEGRPFMVGNQLYRGGYFRLTYRPESIGSFTDENGNEVVVHDPTALKDNDFTPKGYRSSVPPSRHTKARTGFVAPLSLDHDLLHLGFEEVIHDLSYRKALIQAAKILRQPKVSSAIEQSLGPEYLRGLKEWLLYVSGQKVYDYKIQDWWNKSLRWQRRKFVIAQIGFHVWTLLKHGGIAALHMGGEVGLGYLSGAIRDISRNPKVWEKFVEDRSEQVNNVVQDLDKSVNEFLQKQFHDTGTINTLGKQAVWMLAASKEVESKVLWLAKFRQLHEGEMLDYEDAVKLADKAVRDTQGAASEVDLPALYRNDGSLGGELTASLLMFTNFENAAVNRAWTLIAESKQAVRGFKDTGWAGARRDFTRIMAGIMAYQILPIAWATAIDIGAPAAAATWAYDKAVGEDGWGYNVVHGFTGPSDLSAKKIGRTLVRSASATLLGGTNPLSSFTVEAPLAAWDAIHGKSPDELRDMYSSLFRQVFGATASIKHSIDMGTDIKGKALRDVSSFALMESPYAPAASPISHAVQYWWDVNHGLPDQSWTDMVRQTIFGEDYHPQESSKVYKFHAPSWRHR